MTLRDKRAYNEAYKTAAINTAAANTGAYNEAYKTAALNTAAANAGAYNTGAYNEAYKTAALNTAASNTGAYNEAYKAAAANTGAYNTAAYSASSTAGAYNDAYKSASVNIVASNNDAFKSSSAQTGAYNGAYKSADANTATSNFGAFNEGYKSAAINAAGSNSASQSSVNIATSNSGAYSDSYKAANTEASALNSGAYKLGAAFNQNPVNTNAAQSSFSAQSSSEAEKSASQVQQGFVRNVVSSGSVGSNLGSGRAVSSVSVSHDSTKSGGVASGFKSEVVHQTGSQPGGEFKTEIFTPGAKSEIVGHDSLRSLGQNEHVVLADQSSKVSSGIVNNQFSSVNSASVGSQASSVSNQAAFNVASDQAAGQFAQQYPGAPVLSSQYSPVYSIYYKDFNPAGAMPYASYPVYGMRPVEPPVHVLPPSVYQYDHNKV
ncbi:uncharacterized transmembrane protein DDB_G0289901-like [Diaphorina citri]|uniref:Uncharacterized transmembrane protein DDB_G0289901-like n=1 Tax=Diaphorina citri TaxID=121845 RepID=A0A1S3D608_DIACI|nr:uncharacterized transmembrane protein DDB_G0289901-like [Diaphorina citri]